MQLTGDEKSRSVGILKTIVAVFLSKNLSCCVAKQPAI